MPYNLRKRKQPEAVEVPVKPLPQKKRKIKPEVNDPAAAPDTVEEIPVDDSKVDVKKVKVTATKATKAIKATKTTKATETTKATKATKATKPPKTTKPPTIADSPSATEPPTTAEPPTETTTTKKLFMFGNDSCGELGLGKIGISRKAPCEVPLGESIRQVACGPMHTLSLTESGKVYSFGCNDEGALGRETDGDETLEATPTVVPIDNEIIKVTAGDSHSAILTDKNEVFIWGNFRDEHGSVGLTPACEGKASYKPIKLLPDIKFKDIASGSNHVLLLDIDGVVYSFGVGEQGQLGRLKPDEIGENGATKALIAENREKFLTPQKVSLKDVDSQRPFICDAIYAGNFSSFATNTDKVKNRLAGWGLNNYFQLGYKGQKDQLVQHFPKRTTFTCSTNIVGVACGQHHTLFLTKTGRVYSAGRHEYGMLGLGKVDKEVCPAKNVTELGNSIVDISAGINTSFAVSGEGKIYSWGMGGLNLGLQGDDDLKVPTEVTSLDGKKAVSVSVGGSFTAVLVDQ